jgi:importin subunit alpha-1
MNAFEKQDRKTIKATESASGFRGKRADRLSALRKQKKEALMKRRREAPESVVHDPQVLEKLNKLPALVNGLMSNDINVVIEATASVRKLLSMERSPPIDEVINSGVVPRLVQILQSTDNPILQFEAAWALTNIASGTSDHTEVVVKAGAVPVFISLIASPSDDVKEQAIWALGNIAGDSATCRNYILQLGVMQPLLKVIMENPKNTIMRNATWTLSNLCRGKPIPDFNLIKPALPILSHLLYHQDEEVLTDACWALSYMSDGPNDRIQAVIEAQIVRRLNELLMHHSPSVQTPALRTIGNIVTGNDTQTQFVLNSGVLTSLCHLMTHTKKSIKKEACWTISNITAGNKAQIQAVIDAGLIQPLVMLLEQPDFDIKKEAAWAIANATTGGSDEQIKFLVDQGVIKPIVDLLTVKDVKILNVALEALDNILSSGIRIADEYGENNYYADIVEEAGGLEKLEALQTHKDVEVYEKSLRILEDYFGGESDDEQTGVPETGQNAFQFGSNMNLPTGGFNFQ